jgi:hypothetical protein
VHNQASATGTPRGKYVTSDRTSDGASCTHVLQIAHVQVGRESFLFVQGSGALFAQGSGIFFVQGNPLSFASYTNLVALCAQSFVAGESDQECAGWVSSVRHRGVVERGLCQEQLERQMLPSYSTRRSNGVAWWRPPDAYSWTPIASRPTASFGTLP